MTQAQWDAKEEAPIEKLYWSVGEVAKIFKVAPSLIRFWEIKFQKLHTKRSRKGERQFIKEDIETIKKIHHLLKVRRFTIEGAKLELAAKRGSNGLN